MIRQDWSTLKKLMFMKAAAGGSVIEDTATGNPLTFNTNVAKPIRSLLIPFTPVQSGTGDPSPDNVRPVVGITGLTAWRTGKNMLKVSAVSYHNSQNCTYELTETGVKVTATGTYSRRLDVFRVVPGAKYAVSFKGIGTGDLNAVYIQKAATWVIDDMYSRVQLNGMKTEYTYTFTAQTDIVAFAWCLTASATSGTMEISDLQLELADTATPFSPYTGKSYPIDWTDEAGTVYGGTLDLVTGVLTVEWKYVLLNDPDKWRMPGTNATYADTFSDRKTGNAYGFYATCFPPTYKATGTAFMKWSDNTSPTIAIMTNSSGITIDDIKQLATDGDIAICYELAVPQTIQLDHVTVSALVGDNTIWSDTNGENSAVYLKKA